MDVLGDLVEALSRGGVVACPTETWLGLLADARDEEAIERVATLKGRPAHMPIALLIPDYDALVEVALPPSAGARRLMQTYWPGPLTLLVEAKPGLSPRIVHEGKVGVRVPGTSPAAELTRAFGHALTATSANLTGEPPLRSADELPPALRERLDGWASGISPCGPPSTIVDTTRSPMAVLRAGALDLDPAAL